ncbi:sulfite reductase subunit alpha [Pandoraea pneumonica]|uniref:sulfite reductase subunit alpha n=1 Tax=Pandoraea pneumonica TaxID=2508299 RepID=UPI003CF79BED
MSAAKSSTFHWSTLGLSATSVAGAALAWASPARPLMAGGVLLAYLAGSLAVMGAHRRRARQSAFDANVLETPPERTTLIVYASQTGFAELLAANTVTALRNAGVAVRAISIDALRADMLSACRQALFIVSTTGEGDVPDSASGFTRKIMNGPQALSDLRYGVLALGDRSYADFCAFGHRLTHWLDASGAQALFDTIEVDNGDAGAIRHWQNQLSALAGGAQIADWEPPKYTPWRLQSRRLLNPESAGAPAFHLSLVPENDAAALDWQAGDIVEIGPRHSSAFVCAWLRDTGFPASAPVQCDGETMMLAQALASRMPSSASARAMVAHTPQALVDALVPLPHREYSIASLPADGQLDLLVRQARYADAAQPDGVRLGLASGWLTQHAALGASIALRVRANRAFHAPPDDVPLILIGNGTGLAGLRAHLKSRAARGAHRNWLLFGERNARHDAFFSDEIAQWQGDGVLTRVDFAWSRDAGDVRYVQHAVCNAASDIREWIDAGAAIYVCGSLQGMAPAVHAALIEALGAAGAATLDTLTEAGRYRRDVY